MVENNRFEIKNVIEDQTQSIPKSRETLTMLRCIIGPNLEILTTIGGDLWRGQTHDLKLGYILALKLNLTLKVKATYGPNLVILAWKGDEDQLGDGLTD